MAKDLFSVQANAYAKYRPTYPKELFEYIIGFVHKKKCAWDCATGNGQAATVLAGYFQQVDATDISEAQIKNAVQKANVHYQVSPAEQTPFANNSFDLITVAQAYHWLNWKTFHDEATRVGKQDAVIAIWGYNLFHCDDDTINGIIHHFYYNLVHQYWDKERRHLEHAYQTVDFDFAPLPSKDFEIVCRWSKEAFMGYLSSWSTVQHYIQHHGTSPLLLIQNNVDDEWPQNEIKEFRFPLFLKLGRITK